MSMERAVELPSGQHVCLGCGQVLDRVVASFAVLGWDDVTEDYSKVVDVGDFACPYCGEAVHITKFYPPEEQQERPSRPSPKTYGDWVDLAENIKERYPGDPVMRASVSYQLGIIARAEAVEPVVEEAEIEEAKRWLARKAGELDIR